MTGCEPYFAQPDLTDDVKRENQNFVISNIDSVSTGFLISLPFQLGQKLNRNAINSVAP